MVDLLMELAMVFKSDSSEWALHMYHKLQNIKSNCTIVFGTHVVKIVFFSKVSNDFCA